MITDISINRVPTIGNMHRVTFYTSTGVPYSQNLLRPSDIMQARKFVLFIHFFGGEKNNKTYRRPTPLAADQPSAGG